MSKNFRRKFIQGFVREYHEFFRGLRNMSDDDTIAIHLGEIFFYLLLVFIVVVSFCVLIGLPLGLLI